MNYDEQWVHNRYQTRTTGYTVCVCHLYGVIACVWFDITGSN